MYFQRKANKKATLISRNEKVVFCFDSISAMRADTAKMPWKTRESNPCKWLSPPLIFPNPLKKLPPAPWKRPLTPPATYSVRYTFV